MIEEKRIIAKIDQMNELVTFIQGNKYLKIAFFNNLILKLKISL